MKLGHVLVAVLLGLAACSAGEASGPAVHESAPDSSSKGTSAPLLEDGPAAPGRYRYIVRNACDDRPYDCPMDGGPPPPLPIEVTLPAGWQHLPGFPVITPSTETPTQAPDGAALVLGWTNFWVGVNADPCMVDTNKLPDIPVGPTVDDFVDAVAAVDALSITRPTGVELDGHPGRFFSLQAPFNIDRCNHWRPWEPGFDWQGPYNIWDVWAIDVDGFRVLIVANYYPGTPAKIRAELRAMVESVSFGS